MNFLFYDQLSTGRFAIEALQPVESIGEIVYLSVITWQAVKGNAYMEFTRYIKTTPRI